MPKKPAPRKRLDAYIRVSRVRGREGDSYIAEDVQEDRIRRFVDTYSAQYEVVAWHVERDESGKSAKRPLFNQMLKRIEAGQTDGVIVARIDRFARSVSVAHNALQRIKDSKAAFINVDPPLDTTSDYGKFALTMMLAIAELEVDRITSNWNEAREKAIMRGVHISSRCPTGYRREASSQPLQLDPSAAPVIAEVFRLRTAGASLKHLAALLDERGTVGPYGNPRWTSGAVLKLIRNPVYTGEARNGELRHPKAHPSIVSRAEWKAAQRVRPASSSRSKSENGGALLSGLLRCAGCRYVMKPDSMRDRKGNRLRTYSCRNDHAAGTCPAPSSVLGRVIEPHVVGAFFADADTEQVVAKATTAADELIGAARVMEEAEAELDAWVAMDVRGQSERSYKKGLVLRETRLDEAEAEMQRLQAAARSLPGNRRTLRSEWEHLPVEDQRWILSQALEAVFLRRGRGVPIEERSVIVWRSEMTLDLPRRGHRVPLASFEWPGDAPSRAGVAAL